MNLKEYLSQAFTLGNQIVLYEQQLKMLREESRAVGGYGKRVRENEGGGMTRIGEAMTMSLAMANDISAKLQRCLTLRFRIYQIINLLEDGNKRVLLMKRYVNMMTWEEIAEDMDYSVMNCHRLHKKALKELGGLLHKRQTGAEQTAPVNP